MTPTLEGVEWSASRPGRTFPPGKPRYPFCRKLGGPQGRSGRAENLIPTAIRSRTVQPVAQSLYRLSYRAHTNQSKVLKCLQKRHYRAEIPVCFGCPHHDVKAEIVRLTVPSEAAQNVHGARAVGRPYIDQYEQVCAAYRKQVVRPRSQALAVGLPNVVI